MVAQPPYLADVELPLRATTRRGELVRIRSQSGEDPADVRALEGIGDLHPEKAEAEVPHLPKRKFALGLHFTVLISVSISA